tara:strand:- start:2510 stop:4159 length:1650 start_codon:yes stop_codon:yes gene_type:complete
MRYILNICLFAFILTISNTINSQNVITNIDNDSILIGKELYYKIDINLDKEKNIVFPDSTSFVPFEIISETKIDTTANEDGFKFSKTYGITSFDEGEFIIPKIKIEIDDSIFLTNSKKVTVNLVEVDTLKQGLYEIKPSYEPISNFDLFLLIIKNRYPYIILLLLSLIIFTFIIFYFRSTIFEFFYPLIKIKPSLNPIQIAKKRIIELENLDTKSENQIKFFYSELSFALRNFLEKKVYDRSLESTTKELISQLNSIKELKILPISTNSINNIEELLNRADLVKFAKYLPEKKLIKKDLISLDKEINLISDLLPKLTEEERLRDLKYQKEKIKKIVTKRIVIVLSSLLLSLILLFLTSGFLNGFHYTFDKITFNENLNLTEKQWVKSKYGGITGIFVETPDALIRLNDSINYPYDNINLDSRFYYSNSDKSIELYISNYSSKNKIDNNIYQNFLEFSLDPLITEKNILSLKSDEKLEEFTTKNKQKGQIIYGPLKIEIEDGRFKKWGEYKFICFFTESEFKTVFLVHQDKRYLSEISERIISSIEPNKE